jgi:methylmalonyl-CoA mutase N-terminal domain/subunit
VSTYSTVADKLVAALETIATLQDRAYPYPTPNPSTPCAVVVPAPTEFERTYASDDPEQTWTVRVLVGRGDDRSAAQRLYAYLDPTGASSIKAAIEADPTLGGTCDEVWVQGFEEPSIFNYDTGALLGVDFTVIVNF